MQENNAPQAVPQPPPTDEHISESSSPISSGVHQVITVSSPTSIQEVSEATSPISQKNCHSAVIIPTTTTRGDSIDARASGLDGGDIRGGEPLRGSGFNLRRGSSSESIPESHVYTVPIKYRSGVGSFEDHVACGFAKLLSSSSELSDVTIACEGKLIKAHKLVLAISSPYFRQIFEELHDFPCQHPVVILHGVKLKDWENIMRLIYCGSCHVSSTEIDDFMSTAECLKIDGLAAEDRASSSQEETTPPYEYFNRLSASEFQSPEDMSARRMEYEDQQRRSRSFPSYSPHDFSTAKDYSCDRGGGGVSPDSNHRDDGNPDAVFSEQESLLIRCRRQGSSGSLGVISSAQSSPGIGTQSVNRDTLVKVETNETYSHGDSSQEDAPIPCPAEGLRGYSQPASPAESRVQAVRHPVISRRHRDASSESIDDPFEVASQTSSGGFLPSSRMVITSRNGRPSPYPSGWGEHRSLSNSSERDALVIDDAERHFPTVLSGQQSPVQQSIMSTTSTGQGVTTRYPLSVISRQPPAAIPLQQILSPTAAGFLHRMPQLHLLAQGQRSPHDPHPSLNTGGGVITTVPSPHSSPQNHDHHQQSALAILRAKIASGQPIYSRGYRSDRQNPLSNPFNLPRFPSVSGTQLSPHNHMAGPSRSNMFIPTSMTMAAVHHQHQLQQSVPQSARPKTKAIRSSQVPQSARYTAAEVDSMVDKVQNFPGNMVPCAICSKFVKRERLRAHIHECHLLHGKKIVCPHCGIGLKSKGSYRVHIWRHKRGALPAGRQQRHSDSHPESQNPH